MRYKNMFENLQDGGVVVLNVDCNGDMAEYAEKNLPSQMKRDLAKRHAQLFMINANKVATDVGLPGRTNNILILFYFRFGMAGLINFEDAVLDMKLAAKKTYAKRGQAVIDANMHAIEQSVEVIDKCRVQYDAEKWAQLKIEHSQEKMNSFCPDYDTFATQILDPVYRRNFSKISTKMMYRYNNGYLPPGYSLYEKQ